MYIVKILNDIENNYQGIDDVEVYVCSTYRKAINKLSDIFESKVKYFKDEYNLSINDEDLDSEIIADSQFSIHNNRDYFSGKIEEKEVL